VIAVDQNLLTARSGGADADIFEYPHRRIGNSRCAVAIVANRCLADGPANPISWSAGIVESVCAGSAHCPQLRASAIRAVRIDEGSAGAILLTDLRISGAAAKLKACALARSAVGFFRSGRLAGRPAQLITQSIWVGSYYCARIDMHDVPAHCHRLGSPAEDGLHRGSRGRHAAFFHHLARTVENAVSARALPSRLRTLSPAVSLPRSHLPAFGVCLTSVSLSAP